MTAHPARPDGTSRRGATLIELMVAMGLLTLFSALFMAILLPFHNTVRREQGMADAGLATQRALSLFDKQVRYAEEINVPGPGSTPTSSYVEYRWSQAAAGGFVVRCTQWRAVGSTGLLQNREWLATAAPPASWRTVASGVVVDAARSPFSLPENDDPTKIDFTRQMLRLQLTVRNGRAVATQTSTAVTLAALNSTSSLPPTTSVCLGGGGRP